MNGKRHSAAFVVVFSALAGSWARAGQMEGVIGQAVLDLKAVVQSEVKNTPAVKSVERGSDDREFDCGLVIGMSEAAYVLSTPGFYFEEDGLTFRAIYTLHFKSEASMLWALARAVKTAKGDSTKRSLDEIRQLLQALSPRLVGPGTKEAWKAAVETQEKIYEIIDKRMKVLINEACKSL